MSPRAFVVLATVWTLLILVGCWLPARALPREETGVGFELPHQDKMVHATMFAGFGFLWMRAGRSTGRMRWVLGAGLVLAVVTELGQAIPFVNRDPGVLDGVADSVGLVLGVLGSRWFFGRESVS